MKTCRSLLIGILLLHLGSRGTAKVHVHITNKLRNGQSLRIHCRSEDDDLGNVEVENGGEIKWDFSVNFWGTTLFYCNVRWGGSDWRHFDAYSAERDHAKCYSQCRWVIADQGSLLGYDQETNLWEQFPLINSK